MPAGAESSGDCATGDDDLRAGRELAAAHARARAGSIHIESDRDVPFTLGQFFDEWGVRFDARCVGGYCTGGGKELRVYVERAPRARRPAPDRAATSGQEIAVVLTRSDFGSVPSRYTGPLARAGLRRPRRAQLRACRPS